MKHHKSSKEAKEKKEKEAKEKAEKEQQPQHVHIGGGGGGPVKINSSTLIKKQIANYIPTPKPEKTEAKTPTKKYGIAAYNQRKNEELLAIALQNGCP